MEICNPRLSRLPKPYTMEQTKELLCSATVAGLSFRKDVTSISGNLHAPTLTFGVIISLPEDFVAALESYLCFLSVRAMEETDSTYISKSARGSSYPKAMIQASDRQELPSLRLFADVDILSGREMVYLKSFDLQALRSISNP